MPYLTLAIVALSVAASRYPTLSEWLVYDRQAVLGGQVWRLLTAPCVHFSADHLIWNTLVFGAAGWAIESSGFQRSGRVYILAALVPNLLFLVAAPDLVRFGGLSGLATGATAYYACCRMVRDQKGRGLWMGLLSVMAAKIVVEVVKDTAIFVQAEQADFRVVPIAHAIGFGIALATVGLRWLRSGRPAIRRYHLDNLGLFQWRV